MPYSNLTITEHGLDSSFGLQHRHAVMCQRLDGIDGPDFRQATRARPEDHADG